MRATLGLDLWECLTLRLNVFNRHKNTLIFQFLSLRLWEVVIFLKFVDHFLHIILQFMSFSVSVICAFSIFLRESFMDLLILISFFFFQSTSFFFKASLSIGCLHCKPVFCLHHSLPSHFLWSRLPFEGLVLCGLLTLYYFCLSFKNLAQQTSL